MTKPQLVIVWIVGLALSAALFWIGIGGPMYREANPPLAFYPDARAKAIQRNYFIGAVAPILVLGACAFLSTIRKPPD